MQSQMVRNLSNVYIIVNPDGYGECETCEYEYHPESMKDSHICLDCYKKTVDGEQG